MEIVNLSSQYKEKLYSWLPRGLDAQKVVFFPDACPGKSPMPTGTATLLKQPDWRRFAVSDCGCGMRLLRSDLRTAALTPEIWDRLARRLQKNKGGLGDLGGGNHFLDALESYAEDRLSFLIHTGSRNESQLVDALIDRPDKFDREFARIVQWATDNRAAVQEALEAEFGKMNVVLDLPHNTFEVQNDGGVVIRKGVVHVRPGELNIMPSHMAGDVALLRATARVTEALNSLSHGTGRALARSASKEFAAEYDFDELRTRVLIPSQVSNSSLRTDGPYAYRDLDDCLALLDDLVEVEERYAVVGYMGHL